jgi:cytosine permease
MTHGTPDPPADPAAAVPRLPWTAGIAPNYIVLFLWVAFYDQLARQTLSVGGLIPSLWGAVVAGLLCDLLLYHVPAMWGLRTGRPLAIVGTSTFGEAGAGLVPGLLLGVVQVVWFAVATHYAVTFCLEALAAFDLIDPGRLEPWSGSGPRLGSPLFLITALAWVFTFAMVGSWFWRLVTAIMRVFPIAPALVLAAAMLWALPGLASFRPLRVDPVTGELIRGGGGPRAFLMMVQLIFSFFATAGAMAVDWGATGRSPRDVRLGGLVGVALGSMVMATLALLTVAGAVGRAPGSPAPAQARLPHAPEMRAGGPDVWAARHMVKVINADDFTIEAVLRRGIGGSAGGVMLLILALGSMAAAVYASHVFGQRFAAAWPRLSRPSWTFLGAAASYPLVATGAVAHLATIFGLLGAAMSPVVGAMAADSIRHRGAWPGPRRGVNAAGLVAWAVGFLVGMLPPLGRAVGWGPWSQAQPAAVFAFLAGFLVYAALARIGLESPPAAIPAPAESPSR